MSDITPLPDMEKKAIDLTGGAFLSCLIPLPYLSSSSFVL